MPSARQLLSSFVAATLTSSVNAAMGPAFSTGPVGSGSWIREATSTLVLPKAPTGSTGDASLWVGMGTSNGDLIQSIADNWNQDDWNIYAYTLLSTSANTQMPIQADGKNAQAGEKITMHCEHPGELTQSNNTDASQTSSTMPRATTRRSSWSTASRSPRSRPVTARPRVGAAPLSAPKITVVPWPRTSGWTRRSLWTRRTRTTTRLRARVKV
jgi:hypothetical protein